MDFESEGGSLPETIVAALKSVSMAVPTSSLFVPPGLEPGDRFEVTPIGGTGRLSVPRVLGPDGFPIEQIEDPAGRPLDLALDASAGSIVVPKLGEGVSRSNGPLWLEYRAPGRFRLIVEPGAPHPANGSVVTEQGVPIEFDAGDWPVVQAASASAAGLELDQLDLAIRAARLATHAGFDRLICLPLVRDIELLEHQIRTAKTVLRRFRGRAMLCDEVGLGKTIEAGLVLSELMIRGLARSVLVLVPAVADRAVAGRDAPQVLDRAGQPRRPGLPRARHGRLGRVRPRDRLDPHRQARAAPLGDPRPGGGTSSSSTRPITCATATPRPGSSPASSRSSSSCC